MITETIPLMNTYGWHVSRSSFISWNSFVVIVLLCITSSHFENIAYWYMASWFEDIVLLDSFLWRLFTFKSTTVCIDELSKLLDGVFVLSIYCSFKSEVYCELKDMWTLENRGKMERGRCINVLSSALLISVLLAWRQTENCVLTFTGAFRFWHGVCRS